MKPFGPAGLELESAGEALVLADAMDFAHDVIDRENSYYGILGEIATLARNRGESWLILHGDNAAVANDNPFVLRFHEKMGADLVGAVVRGAAASHPDPLVRLAAENMNRSYEEHVFNAAMGGETPPPADGA